ncbi:HAD family hydrolase [Niastella populi]|uniref:phosphoglycolate phosphatase n=1 Tax=Niastella populi TaxID=550983 RepID=A0A1V9FHU9_9BACT|nr:HAD family hydrolase [Niastella populi]OQP57841.1 hypothetical protein A4R26_23315 [Niastella populi]
MGVVFDLDQTLIDSSIAESHRTNRNWSDVYQLIPQFSLYPGIIEAIAYLEAHTVPFCIVTSSPGTYCDRVIAHWNINCNQKVCYHDTARRKPHPDPIIKAISMMKATPESTLSLGDRNIDIQASHAAGVKSVACLWGAADPDSLIQLSPSFVAQQPDELIPLFKQFFTN